MDMCSICAAPMVQWMLHMCKHTCCIHTAYIHTAYIHVTLLHILGTYTAYMLHIKASFHVCCIHKNWNAPHVCHIQAHEVCRMHACRMCAVVHMQHVCFQHMSNCMYAAHNHCTHCAHFTEMCADLICLCVAHVWRCFKYSVWSTWMCPVCSTYAACIFNTCRKVTNMCAAYKQHFCKGYFNYFI